MGQNSSKQKALSMVDIRSEPAIHYVNYVVLNNVGRMIYRNIQGKYTTYFYPFTFLNRWEL